MFKMQKVFDCQDMPQGVRGKFLEDYDNDAKNGFYLCIEAYLDKNDYEGYHRCIAQWLIDNGAAVGEFVLIKYRW